MHAHDTAPNSSKIMNSSRTSSKEHHTGTHLEKPIIRPTVLLATARIDIDDKFGQRYPARALLDQGSEISIISERLIKGLGLPRQHSALTLNGIGSAISQVSKGIVSLTIHSLVSDFSIHISAFILPEITGCLPSTSLSDLNWAKTHKLPLADPSFHIPDVIDILLGADVYGKLLCNGLIIGTETEPTAQETTLGWILSGTVLTSNKNHRWRQASSVNCKLDVELYELTKLFWLQEELFVTENTSNIKKDVCYKHFKETHSRNINGRFIVRLPFNTSPESLGKSLNISNKRLLSLETRCARNTELKNAYKTFMKDYESTGHMSKVTHRSLFAGKYYLPHHGVWKETSTTTKLRVVFNGSQSTSSGKSLNDILHEGPKLHRDLHDVITNWRKYPFVFSADIAKMFRQILIHRSDRDFQCILWRESEKTPIQEYTLNTVTYGTRPAPFLAMACLQELEKDDGWKYPLARNVISTNTYVDDVLTGAYSLDEGKEKAKQTLELFQSGGFPIRKWITSHQEILEQIPSGYHEMTPLMEIKGDPIYKTLGLSWNSRSDSFCYTSNVKISSSTITKRMVLSQLSQIFDPFGWITPILVKGKIFMQKVWQQSIGWDDALSMDMQKEWLTYIEKLRFISEIKIPRWLRTTLETSVELHGFADASLDAIGAVIYLRTCGPDNLPGVTMVVSKSKLAPIKRKNTTSRRVTIPRLELCAATLLVSLMDHIQITLGLPHAKIHLWTDSSVTLFWILGTPSRWKDFVRNRVLKIQETIPSATWHHVPGDDNPADLASRGVSPTQLIDSELWWNGPKWLKDSVEQWPRLQPVVDDSLDMEIRIAKATTLAVRMHGNEPIEPEFIRNQSTLSKLLRITGWCLRFCENARAKITGKHSNHGKFLTTKEIMNVQQTLEKVVQQIFLQEDIQNLKLNNQVESTHRLHRLTPQLDSNGILRVGGRLENAQIQEESKHPIILPENAHFSTLVLRNVHEKTLHGGTQIMLSNLRQRYWILGGREPVRRYIKTCVQCVRYQGRHLQQLMGQLPTSRVSPSRPFVNTGVDYAGPFTIKCYPGRNTKTYKGYLVVFVCMTSSAVHLDMATDYSAKGFLDAFRRFVSRRGHCANLYSDCGTNFVGADSELKRIYNRQSKEFSKLMTELSTERTVWHFNPPASPHFGGKWEAAVKSVKHHIKRIVNETLMTYEEWATLLTQIESILNSRPLCPMTNDPEDLEPLTPGHFLIGNALTLVPETNYSSVTESRLTRLQLHKRFVNQFWNRWSMEYLQRFLIRTKWKNKLENVKLGSMVLLMDDRLPPGKWPLARIVDLHPGKDGLIRVATIVTATSTFKRPIVKLCLLPVDPPPGRDLISLAHLARQGGENVTAGGNITVK